MVSNERNDCWKQAEGETYVGECILIVASGGERHHQQSRAKTRGWFPSLRLLLPGASEMRVLLRM